MAFASSGSWRASSVTQYRYRTRFVSPFVQRCDRRNLRRSRHRHGQCRRACCAHCAPARWLAPPLPSPPPFFLYSLFLAETPNRISFVKQRVSCTHWVTCNVLTFCRRQSSLLSCSRVQSHSLPPASAFSLICSPTSAACEIIFSRLFCSDINYFTRYLRVTEVGINNQVSCFHAMHQTWLQCWYISIFHSATLLPFLKKHGQTLLKSFKATRSKCLDEFSLFCFDRLPIACIAIFAQVEINTVRKPITELYCVLSFYFFSCSDVTRFQSLVAGKISNFGSGWRYFFLSGFLRQLNGGSACRCCQWQICSCSTHFGYCQLWLDCACWQWICDRPQYLNHFNKRNKNTDTHISPTCLYDLVSVSLLPNPE